MHSCRLLSHLDISQCPNLSCLRLPSLPGLEILEICGIRERVLQEIMLLAAGSSLKSVSIQSIDDLMCLPDELHQHASTIQTLTLGNCPLLATLPHWMGNLTSPIDLKIYGCPELMISLPPGMRSPPILPGL